ncbi:MAG: hypothetical protein ACPHRO_06405 [Nannocystaceae bacterium]
MTAANDARAIEQILARERLAIDLCADGRTSFLSHVGATRKLVPGPWIAHRDLIYALALTNLSVNQRSSLAHAVRVEHGREFGVGRCALVTSASGLPFGGSNLLVRPKISGPVFLYTYALAANAAPTPCEWMLLRAQPEWTRGDEMRALGVRGIDTLIGLGGDVLILVPTVVAAKQIASLVKGRIALMTHPRFSPLIFSAEEQPSRDANLIVWPHDGLTSPLLHDREIRTIVVVDGDHDLLDEVGRWSQGRDKLEVVTAACPGRIGRVALKKFWEACERPRILLRGTPREVRLGTSTLEEFGARVTPRAEGTQLGLF